MAEDTKQLTNARLEEIAAQINRAKDMVSELCNGKRDWMMSIPARPDHDPDLLIGDALHAAEDLFVFVRRQQSALDSIPAQIEAAVVAEREACAEVVESKYLGRDYRRDERDDCYDQAITDAAAAIRSRGEEAK